MQVIGLGVQILLTTSHHLAREILRLALLNCAIRRGCVVIDDMLGSC